MSIGDIGNELRVIRASTTLAGIVALLHGEIGAALVAIPVYLLTRLIGLAVHQLLFAIHRAV